MASDDCCGGGDNDGDVNGCGGVMLVVAVVGSGGHFTIKGIK